MNILIDVGHPAHVHLFRNAARAWSEHGHTVKFAIRQRDIVGDLLKAYGFEFNVASKARSGLAGLAWELVEHDWGVLKLALKMRADLLLGTSVSITHTARLVGGRSLVFNEDDVDYLKSFAKLAYPFADAIIVPETLRDPRNRKYVTYPSYHELAYLHPGNFTPDPTILAELGVRPGETFYLVRLVALKAHHDVGQAGLSATARRRLVEMLAQKGRVFITAEGRLPDEFKPYQMPIPPHRIHHALHYASMLVSDSQTMTIEAAVLGTPAIRCSTFVGVCSVIEELEHKYGLTYGFLPSDEERMFARLAELLADEHLKETWLGKRDAMLSEKIDLNAWMVDFIEQYPQSFERLRWRPKAS